MSGIDRCVEPELMVDEDQARAYSDADFTEPHQAAVERFHDYAASLRAAFTIEEVRAQVDDRYTVAAVTDRHLVVIGRT